MRRGALAITLLGLGCASLVPAAAQDAAWALQTSAHIRPFVDAHKPRPMPPARNTVQVRFEVDRAGTVSRAAVARSSGTPALDAAALAAVRAASPVPAPGATVSVTLPVVFDGRRRSERGVRPNCRGC